MAPVPEPAALAPAEERREALKVLFAQASTCTRCPELAATRHTVVFGSGNANAELMFVGEAPGASEDQQGVPFVGQAGKLLERLLGEIGLARADVFIANVLKCRPPGNRDPLPIEIENCREYLFGQVELVAPRIICSLGNFSTKLLRGDPAGITRVHGQAEVIVLGRRAVRLYPIFHPAAALYTPRMLETLREDFARIPQLLRLPAPHQPQIADELDEPMPADAEFDDAAAAESGAAPGVQAAGVPGSEGVAAPPDGERAEVTQLGLF
jgi:uracil-DNA glycosylase family 4